jgi:hypothetical protein
MRILIFEKIKNRQILPYVGVHLRHFYAMKRKQEGENMKKHNADTIMFFAFLHGQTDQQMVVDLLVLPNYYITFINIPEF